MHFYCKCGNRISDTTDMISYKAHVIPDQDWDNFVDEICDAIESKETDREKVIQNFFSKTLNADKLMYQCTQCGCIFIDDEDNTLRSFVPEGVVNTNILNSVKGENWKGFLQAEWKDEIPQWQEHYGNIYPIVNVKFKNLEFDDFQEFEDRFMEIFKELKAKKIIRYARMKCNNKNIFNWDEKE